VGPPRVPLTTGKTQQRISTPFPHPFTLLRVHCFSLLEKVLAMALFVCDQCRLSMNVSDDFANRQAKCPKCGQVSRVSMVESLSANLPEPGTDSGDRSNALGGMDETADAASSSAAAISSGEGKTTPSQGNHTQKIIPMSSILLFLNWLVVIAAVILLTMTFESSLATKAAVREKLSMERLSETEIVSATVIYLSRIILAYILGRSMEKLIRLFA
jgi:hypothetical protein